MQLPAQQPYQWYLIDFGSAVFYDPTDPLAFRPFIDGTHRTARRGCPDYQKGGRFDPFAFDVYCWGDWISGLSKKVNLDFLALKQLTKEMTHPEPHMRPSSDLVLKRLTREISDFRALLETGSNLQALKISSLGLSTSSTVVLIWCSFLTVTILEWD
ncbi:hypothetical protein B0H17DRAFT_230113 [Mycena rosella]|uniref:Protein kinase domain-containing protein n=1 Tax=Mycena rosella TaxID=1033263 RepID=A0AAD7H0M5_MYCRO|nr:hypothetical protein B0H17DRAFT_230113 [Mycena rosella]